MIVLPVRSIVPESIQFPVSGEIAVPVPGYDAIRLRVNPTSYIGKVLFWKGISGFEPEVHKVFKSLIGRARTFLDVGANIGYYSVLASTYNPDSRVISFEPLPSCFKYLSLNVKLNNAQNVNAYQLAVSDEVGNSSFFFSLNPKYLFVEDQLTSTGSLDVGQATRSKIVEEIPVILTTLDDFLPTIGVENVDLIKLDTEATEHLVLDGARETIEKHKPIILCEVLPGKVEAEIMSRTRIFGYQAFMITEVGLVEVENLDHDRTGTNDYLFAPPEKRTELHSLLA